MGACLDSRTMCKAIVSNFCKTLKFSANVALLFEIYNSTLMDAGEYVACEVICIKISRAKICIYYKGDNIAVSYTHLTLPTNREV